MRFGVDLSEYQKGISMERLKQEGVEFAILRGGDGGYRDKQFDILYEAANAQGIPVGAYWFSRATTAQQARQEAQAMLSRLRGKEIRLPVYLDLEADALQKIGKRALTDCLLSWAETIRAAGYLPGVYTTANWLRNNLYLSELDGVERWIAQWSRSKPSLQCGMWQFGGETNLLRSTNLAGYTVDQNYMLRDYLEADEEEKSEVRYVYLKDVPDYAKATVEKLMKAGYLNGTQGQGEETVIDLGEDAVRLLVVLDRAGAFERNGAGATAQEVIAQIALLLTAK